MEELNEMMDNKEVLDQYIDSEGMIKDVKENIERFKNNTIQKYYEDFIQNKKLKNAENFND